MVYLRIRSDISKTISFSVSVNHYPYPWPYPATIRSNPFLRSLSLRSVKNNLFRFHPHSRPGWSGGAPLLRPGRTRSYATHHTATWLAGHRRFLLTSVIFLLPPASRCPPLVVLIFFLPGAPRLHRRPNRLSPSPATGDASATSPPRPLPTATSTGPPSTPPSFPTPARSPDHHPKP
jgi:hypothetical protein